MQYSPVKVPILFLIFNRPDTTQKVFEKVRRAQPSRLYVAADGPRKDRSAEAEKCKEAREIATNVDWNCDVKTLYRDQNLGCKYAVSGAIDWLFKNEEMGIILEDDCVPDESFFRYCEELLHRYLDDKKVMTISGNNFQPKRRTENSYYFSKYMHCWGWASWGRAWKYFDLEMKEWLRLRRQNFLYELLKSNKGVQYWKKRFNRVYAGEVDSWAYIWQYSIWKEQGINILPEKNLVTNIGFDKDGTHTTDKFSEKANLALNELDFPLKHPQSITLEEKADKFTQNHHFQTPVYKRLISKLKKEIFK